VPRRGLFVSLVLAAVTVAAASGCTDVVAGQAQPADAAGPDGPRSGDLAATLLSVEEVNSIMGADDIEVVESVEEMVDHSSDVSDPACLGALYNAEELVYRSSGWTEVVDEVLTEPSDDPAYWVEQTAVRFASADEASKFYDTSKSQWQDCVDREISVFDGDYVFTWSFEAMTVTDTMISQSALQLDSDGWTCQHAMSAVSDVVVEASACTMTPDDEAVTITEALVKNAG
jgi:hypothetical protein